MFLELCFIREKAWWLTEDIFHVEYIVVPFVVAAFVVIIYEVISLEASQNNKKAMS